LFGTGRRKGDSLVRLSGMELTVETKVLKQLVRDIIQPDRDLGHSDKKGHKAKESEESTTNGSDIKQVQNVTESIQTIDVGTSEGAASQFREVAEQACEDCQ
jgi:hypothetical protein